MRAALPLAIAAMALSGCAQLFQYQPAPGEQTAVLKLAEKRFSFFVALNDKEGCPKKHMDLSKPEIKIPANKRLWLEPTQVIQAPLGQYTCAAPMSFVAQAEKEYFVVYELAGNACTARILTRDDAGKLALEPSLEREKFEQCIL